MFKRFAQRSRQLERLDTGDYTSAEYARWEREMHWIHRVFGEQRALEGTLVSDIRARKLQRVSILDVGAGSGNLLTAVKDALNGAEVHRVGLEVNDIALASMRAAKLDAVKADGLKLPFDDSGVDYVICSLLLHHLSDSDALALVVEMDRVAKVNFYVVDLNRHPVGYYGFRLLSPIFFQKFTQEDGALSILRSFTPAELRELARNAGVASPRVVHSRANRLVLSRR